MCVCVCACACACVCALNCEIFTAHLFPTSPQRLREEIPELEDNQRAPKVTILRKAMDFIRHMQDIERATEAELVAEKQRKAQLLDRLNKLRSSRV